MKYVLLYILVVNVYVLNVESLCLKLNKYCFVNSTYLYKSRNSLNSTDSENFDFELLESPSKTIIDDKFFNLNPKVEDKGVFLTDKDKVEWASYEIRRFTYKLGRYNKKLRKIKNKRKLVYSNFNVDEDELKKLNLESRSLSKSIQTFRRFRSLFLHFLKGLKLNNNPTVPYVPTRLRSSKVPIKYYLLSPKPEFKKVKKIKSKKDKEEGIDSLTGEKDVKEIEKGIDDKHTKKRKQNKNKDKMEESSSYGDKKLVIDVDSENEDKEDAVVEQRLKEKDQQEYQLQQNTSGMSPTKSEETVSSQEFLGSGSMERGSMESNSSEGQARRSRRAAAINQRLLMKKIASQEPVGVSDDGASVSGSEEIVGGTEGEIEGLGEDTGRETGTKTKRETKGRSQSSFLSHFNTSSRNTVGTKQKRRRPPNKKAHPLSRTDIDTFNIIFSCSMARNTGLTKVSESQNPGQLSYPPQNPNLPKLNLPNLKLPNPFSTTNPPSDDRYKQSSDPSHAYSSSYMSPLVKNEQGFKMPFGQNLGKYPGSLENLDKMCGLGGSEGSKGLERLKVERTGSLGSLGSKDLGKELGREKKEKEKDKEKNKTSNMFGVDGLRKLEGNDLKGKGLQLKGDKGSRSDSKGFVDGRIGKYFEKTVPEKEKIGLGENYFDYVENEENRGREKITAEQLENPGVIYNFNEIEMPFVKKKRKVLVNMDHVFVKGLKYIKEYLEKNSKTFPGDLNGLRSMGLDNYFVDPEYFLQTGGDYSQLKDDVDVANRMIESLQAELNDLHTEMGKTQLTKINEPSVQCCSSTYSIANKDKEKDKALEYEEILEEMKDFQDLVNDEHREKRRLFKNLIMGTSKYIHKMEMELNKTKSEKNKHVLILYKNISNMIDLFWKKIEKFAWEHLKKDLQQELMKKKKENLDKFIQDAIKVSINDQDRYIFKQKMKGTGTNTLGVSNSSYASVTSNTSYRDNDNSKDNGNRDSNSSSTDKTSTTTRNINSSKSPNRSTSESNLVNGKEVEKESDYDNKYTKKRKQNKVEKGSKGKVHEKDELREVALDEDDEEITLGEEDEKMEVEDLKLEEEMESDKEEGELDALQKDLEMPIEELLKMYQAEAGDYDYQEDQETMDDSGYEYENEYHKDRDSHQYADYADDQDNEGENQNKNKNKDLNDEQEYSKEKRKRGRKERGNERKEHRSNKTKDTNDRDKQDSENKNKERDKEKEDELREVALDEDDEEITLGEEDEKMEVEDLKLEEEMESDKEEGELDALQKDLEMPIEELLKMYQSGVGEEYYEEESLSASTIQSHSPSPKRQMSTKRETMDKKLKNASQEPAGVSDDGASVSGSEEIVGGTEGEIEGLGEDTGRETGTKNIVEVDAKVIGKVKTPFLIRGVLRPYQREGLGWLVSLYQRGINGVLADEMGLGKTLQAISLLAHLACVEGNWGPHIIIVPTSILLNWVMEFNKFCPGFKVLAYYGSQTERARKRSGWNRPHSFNVMIASYSTVVQDAYVLKRKVWEYMILDEAQNIKNFHSKRWQTLLTFNTKYRLLLTGTPLQNSLQELWSLMHFILPNIFTSHTQFNIWFTDPLNQALDNMYSNNPLYKDKDAENKNSENNEKEEMNRNNMELVEKLHVIFRPYLLRRLKKDVEKQMPSKYEHVLKCTLTRRQQVLYDEYISLYNLNSSKGGPKEGLSYKSMLNILMQLRKICNHPNQLRSRDVEIPIVFNISTVQLPSFFNVLSCESRTDFSNYTRLNLFKENQYSRNGYTNGNGSVDEEEQKNQNKERKEDKNKSNKDRTKRDNSENKKEKKEKEDEKEHSGHVSSYFTRKHYSRSDSGKSSWEGYGQRNYYSYSSSPNRHSGHSPTRQHSKRRGEQSDYSNEYDSGYEYENEYHKDKDSHQYSDYVDDQDDDGDEEKEENYTSTLQFPRKCKDRLVLDSRMKRKKLDTSFGVQFLLKSAETVENGTDTGNYGNNRNENNSHQLNSSNSEQHQSHSPSRYSGQSPNRQHSKAEKNNLNNNELDNNTKNSQHLNNNNLSSLNGLSNSNGLNGYCNGSVENRLMGEKTVCEQLLKREHSMLNLNLGNKLEVNKVIENYVGLVMNFLFMSDKVVSRPVRLYFSGRSGVNFNNRQEWHMEEISTKLFKRDDKEYFKKNLVTVEAVNSQYRLLFPSKRSLNDDCGKFRVLGPLLLKLRSEGHRCIVYTQFSKMLDILENWINFMGFTYTRLDGSTKVEMRQKIINRFNENTKIFLFISSTRSGGVGITLTGADTVVFYDTDWNPAIDRQAMDRCHRIGQTKDVNVYRLISEHTVEENIWRKQLQKRKLDDLIVDQGQFDIQHNNWFSNVDTLINIFQNKRDDDEDDEEIYGRKILHESAVDETQIKPTGVQSLKMLIEVEDVDDSMALKKLTKENEKINKQDFENDIINIIPGLVTYCIKFLLKYQTVSLVKQVEAMKLKIHIEDYQKNQKEEEEEDEDEDDIYTDYTSSDEGSGEEMESDKEEGEDYDEDDVSE